MTATARTTPDTQPPTEPVLTVTDLRVSFRTPRGPARVVNGLNYEVRPGETLAIVGESGSGKSVGVMSLVGLVPQPPAQVSGSVTFAGTPLVGASASTLRQIRGPGIGMVFQDPMSSLNPVLTVGQQITEGIREHQGLGRRAARARALDLLGQVGIPDPRARLDAYPHQLSGGMRQRVMIAIALSCEPRLLIADEATTALDVTIQAQIVELLADLQSQLGMALIWITHDLGVVAGIADRVMIMYAGQIVEEGLVDEIYDDPRHPYTLGLLGSLPAAHSGSEELAVIPGLPPDPTDLPTGCAFWPRCTVRGDARCETEMPPLVEAGSPTHRVATLYGGSR